MTGDERAAAAGAGCTRWGCLGVLALAVAAMVFGPLPVIHFMMFALCSASLARGLLRGRFDGVFASGEVRRDARPVSYWSLAAFEAFVAGGSLWLFVEDIRKAWL